MHGIHLYKWKRPAFLLASGFWNCSITKLVGYATFRGLGIYRSHIQYKFFSGRLEHCGGKVVHVHELSQSKNHRWNLHTISQTQGWQYEFEHTPDGYQVLQNQVEQNQNDASGDQLQKFKMKHVVSDSQTE